MNKKKYVNKYEVLDFNKFYHIYNKAVGSELLFKTEKDYYYFLSKFDRYLCAFAEIYTYCLIPNHFHFLIRIKEESEIIENIKYRGKEFSFEKINQAFSNFFNSYTKSFNKIHKRNGKLFILPYKRILVDKEDYLLILINYIHRNPIHHGLTDNFSDWKYSSYNACFSDKPTKIKREEIISIFGTREDFIKFHQENKEKPGSEKYYLE